MCSGREKTAKLITPALSPGLHQEGIGDGVFVHEWNDWLMFGEISDL